MAPPLRVAEVGASPNRAERGVPAHPLASAALPPSRAKMSTQTKAVVEWRRSELLHCGFPPSLAGRVAEDERYDLRELIELVDRGCAPALAVQILSPLGGSDQLAEARE